MATYTIDKIKYSNNTYNLIDSGAIHNSSGILIGTTNNFKSNGTIVAEEGIFNKLIATSANISTLDVDSLTAQNATVVGLLDVQGQLKTNTWSNSNIATIEGNFFIAPTLATNGTLTSGDTKLTISKTNNIWEIAIAGSFLVNQIGAEPVNTSDTSTNQWTAGSIVLLTGEIAKDDGIYPLGTLKGEIKTTPTMNSTTGIATNISITKVTDNLGNTEILDILGTNSYYYRNIKISLTQRYYSGLRPIGILMSAQGRSSKSFIDIYGGANALQSGTISGASSDFGGLAIPNVRIGNLRGLPNVRTGDFTSDNALPTGWGIYTDNGYFKGTIVSTYGEIGGYSLDANYLKSIDGTTGISVADNSTTENWAFWAGGTTTSTAKFRVDHSGVLYATGAQISGNVTATQGFTVTSSVGGDTLASMTGNGITLGQTGSGKFNILITDTAVSDKGPGILLRQGTNILNEITATGMKLYLPADLTNSIADFSSTIRIGKESSENAFLNITNNSLVLYGAGNQDTPIFNVGLYGVTQGDTSISSTVKEAYTTYYSVGQDKIFFFSNVTLSINTATISSVLITYMICSYDYDSSTKPSHYLSLNAILSNSNDGVYAGSNNYHTIVYNAINQTITLTPIASTSLNSQQFPYINQSYWFYGPQNGIDEVSPTTNTASYSLYVQPPSGSSIDVKTSGIFGTLVATFTSGTSETKTGIARSTTTVNDEGDSITTSTTFSIAYDGNKTITFTKTGGTDISSTYYYNWAVYADIQSYYIPSVTIGYNMTNIYGAGGLMLGLFNNMSNNSMYSATIGTGLESNNSNSLFIGTYNSETKALLSVGNGTSNSSRSDAFTVFSDGKVDIGTGLYIKGGQRIYLYGHDSGAPNIYASASADYRNCIYYNTGTYSSSNNRYHAFYANGKGAFYIYDDHIATPSGVGATIQNTLTITKGGLKVSSGGANITGKITTNSSIIVGAHIRPSSTSGDHYCGTSSYPWNRVYTDYLWMGRGSSDGSYTNNHGLYSSKMDGWLIHSDSATGTHRIYLGYNTSGLRICPHRTSTNGSNGLYLGDTTYTWNKYYGYSADSIGSDRKIKDDIHSISYAKDLIMQLKPVEYYLKDSDYNRRHMGFIAQDVAEIGKKINQNLSVYEANYKDEAKGKYQGEDVDDSELTWTLAYTELIAPLVQVVQDQQKEIDQLKKEIIQLKNK